MKNTTQSANGTSFHSTTINATVKQLRQILGEPSYEDNFGDDKVNFEWTMETDDGDIFTVYDWKQYRSIGESEKIEWHIGGHNRSVTEQAKKEIEKARKAK